MLKDFKDFALEGNLIAIAVAFVLGVGFEQVISALTEVSLALSLAS